MAPRPGDPAFIGPVVNTQGQMPLNNAGRKGATGPGKGAVQMPGRPTAPTPVIRPPAPAAAPVVAPPSYEALFQQGLNRANRSVGQQFGMALADIANREAATKQMLGQLPGQYDTIFGDANRSMNQGAGAMQQAFQNANMTNYIDPNAFLQPILMGLQSNHAAYKADVPTLGLATTAEFGRQRSEVEQERAAAQAEADARARSEAQNFALARMEREWNLQDRAADRRFGLQDARRERRWGLEDAALERAGRQAEMDQEIVDEITGMTAGDFRKSQTDPAFKNFVNKVTDRYGIIGKTIDADKIEDAIDKSGLPPKIKNALRYTFRGEIAASAEG